MLATMAPVKTRRPSVTANGRLAKMTIIKFFQKKRPTKNTNGRLAMMKIIGKFYRGGRPQKNANGRLAMMLKTAKTRMAMMPIIGMSHKRQMLPATMSYITPEITNDGVALMDIIDMFFKKRIRELPATMGNITPDTAAEIATGRLAMMDAIISFYVQTPTVVECDMYWDPAGVWSRRPVRWRRARTRTRKHGRISMLILFLLNRESMTNLGFLQKIKGIFLRRSVPLQHGGISMQAAAKVVAYIMMCDVSASSERRLRCR